MKVLVFGATGSAGGSVLNVCLKAPVVDEVQVVTRRPLTKAHAKLQATTEGISKPHHREPGDSRDGATGWSVDLRS